MWLLTISFRQGSSPFASYLPDSQVAAVSDVCSLSVMAFAQPRGSHKDTMRITPVAAVEHATGFLCGLHETGRLCGVPFGAAASGEESATQSMAQHIFPTLLLLVIVSQGCGKGLKQWGSVACLVGVQRITEA